MIFSEPREHRTFWYGLATKTTWFRRSGFLGHSMNILGDIITKIYMTRFFLFAASQWRSETRTQTQFCIFTELNKFQQNAFHLLYAIIRIMATERTSKQWSWTVSVFVRKKWGYWRNENHWWANHGGKPGGSGGMSWVSQLSRRSSFKLLSLGPSRVSQSLTRYLCLAPWQWTLTGFWYRIFV